MEFKNWIQLTRTAHELSILTWLIFGVEIRNLRWLTHQQNIILTSDHKLYIDSCELQKFPSEIIVSYFHSHYSSCHFVVGATFLYVLQLHHIDRYTSCI